MLQQILYLYYGFGSYKSRWWSVSRETYVISCAFEIIVRCQNLLWSIRVKVRLKKKNVLLVNLVFTCNRACHYVDKHEMCHYEKVLLYYMYLSKFSYDFVKLIKVYI